MRDGKVSLLPHILSGGWVTGTHYTVLNEGVRTLCRSTPGTGLRLFPGSRESVDFPPFVPEVRHIGARVDL